MLGNQTNDSVSGLASELPKLNSTEAAYKKQQPTCDNICTKSLCSRFRKKTTNKKPIFLIRSANSSKSNVSKNEWVCNHSFRRNVLCKSAFNKRTEKTHKKLRNILKPSQNYSKLVTKSNQISESKCSTPIPRAVKQNSNNLNSMKIVNNKKANLNKNRPGGLITIFKKLNKAKKLNDASSPQRNTGDTLNSKGIFNLSFISSRSEASSGRLIPKCTSDSSLNYFDLEKSAKATRGNPNESKTVLVNLVNQRNNRFDKKQRIMSIFNQLSLASSLKFIQNSKLIESGNKFNTSRWTSKLISIKRLNKTSTLNKRHSVSDIREAKKKFISRKKVLNLIFNENQLVTKSNPIENQKKLHFFRASSDSKLIINEEIIDDAESGQLNLNWNSSDTFKMPSNLKGLFIDSGKSKLGLKFER